MSVWKEQATWRVGALAMLGALCAVALWAGRSEATIVVKLDVEGLSTSADDIVMGRVRAVTPRWEGQRIVTDVRVEVAMPVSGATRPGQEVTVQVLGGRVGDLAQWTPGVSRFSVGEDVVLFLARRPEAPVAQVVGLSQGKYRVVRGPDEQLWAVRDVSGLTLAEVEAGQGTSRQVARFVHDAPTELGALPLDTLLRGVVASLRQVDVPVRPEVLERLGERPELRPDFTPIFESLTDSARVAP